MKEIFVSDLMAKLSTIIPSDLLRDVQTIIELHIDDYEITKRNTEVVLYEDFTPSWYQAYIVSQKIEGMSDDSLRQYMMYLKNFFEWLQDIQKPIEKITPNDLRVYLYTLQKTRKISNRTLDGRRTVLNTFLEWGTNEGYLNKNPCRAISVINYEKKDPIPLTAIEMEQIRKACRTIREKAIVEFFYSTGCRVTELIRMDKKDVDFERCEVYLFGKGNKHRTSYLSARAKLMLIDYLKSRKGDSEALFTGERAPYERLKKPAVEKIIKQIGKRSEVNRRVYPHLIRHTTATDCLERGMDITEVQQLLGHADISTTMIYAKRNSESVKFKHQHCMN